MKLKQWYHSGSPWVWLTAGAVSIALISVLGVLLLITVRGLSHFWPNTIVQIELNSESASEYRYVYGQIYEESEITRSQLIGLGVDTTEANTELLKQWLIKLGNREFIASEFIWLNELTIQKITEPKALVQIERKANGDVFGTAARLKIAGKWTQFTPEKLKQLITKQQIIQTKIQKIQTKIQKIQIQNLPEVPTQQQLKTNINQQKYTELEKQLFSLQQQLKTYAIEITDFREQPLVIPVEQVIDIIFPNQMNLIDKFLYFIQQLTYFISENPREANTEGGVFPAIFGTVFMVFLMTIVVMPLGVVAAIYLHEYAKQNWFTRLIRLAVINLAGVPSIVYGVFGLGFFVYFLGTNVDQLFYSDTLPTPTFGTPGMLWSALTLAILTLPVVIVSTEEGLARIPASIRHASYALGARQHETIFKIILPIASPAMMTGMILAIARAAGEVAPLMLVGVAKIAPALPVDGNFPYVHLERKFMHLGFHIYDVGFQSPNIEAARPLVYASALLLVLVIISLNLTAISVRNYLREKYRALEN